MAVAGIGEVCTDPRFRRCGLSSVLLDLARDTATRLGCGASLLHAREHLRPYYQSRGWARSLDVPYAALELDGGAVQEEPVSLPGWSLRPANMGEGVGSGSDDGGGGGDLKRIAEIYAHFNRDLVGCDVRSPEYWRAWAVAELRGRVWVAAPLLERRVAGGADGVGASRAGGDGVDECGRAEGGTGEVGRVGDEVDGVDKESEDGVGGADGREEGVIQAYLALVPREGALHVMEFGVNLQRRGGERGGGETDEGGDGCDEGECGREGEGDGGAGGGYVSNEEADRVLPALMRAAARGSDGGGSTGSSGGDGDKKGLLGGDAGEQQRCHYRFVVPYAPLQHWRLLPGLKADDDCCDRGWLCCLLPAAEAGGGKGGGGGEGSGGCRDMEGGGEGEAGGVIGDEGGSGSGSHLLTGCVTRWRTDGF